MHTESQQEIRYYFQKPTFVRKKVQKHQSSQKFLICDCRTAELKKQLDDALEQIDEMKAARQRQADMVSESVPTHQSKLTNFSREVNVGASFAKQ